MSITSLDFLSQFGEALLNNGYTPIPIQPSRKVPGSYQEGRWGGGFPQWTRFLDSPPSLATLEVWSSWPGAGIGLVTGDIVGVDIDILETDLASAIVEKADVLLGKSPLLRIGREPKVLLVYRSAERMKKRSLGKIEILGEGQQFVSYGLHPDTNQPYKWPVQSPVDVPVHELPVVSVSSIERFLDAISPLVKVPIVEAQTSSSRTPPIDFRSSISSGKRGGAEEVAQAMAFISNDNLPWDEWTRIGMAVFAATAGAGFEIFDEWSKRSSKYDSETTRKRWEEIRRSPPDRIGDGLIFRLARESGWRPQSKQADSAPLLKDERLRGSGSQVSVAVPDRAFRFLAPEEILEAPTQQTWLIKNVLEVGGLAMLVGESGVGKSFVVIDMAVSVALGDPWLDLPTARGAVFVIAGEGYSGFRNRLKAIAKHRGRALTGVPLFFSNAAISLNDPTSVLTARREIEHLTEKHGEPALIVIDTLHRNAGGADENSAKDISSVLKEIDSKLRVFGSNCAVLIVHHSGHGEKTRARGSSSLYGAMDTELLIKKAGEDTVTLSVTKQKNHEPMSDIALRFLNVDLDEAAEDGQLLKSRVVVKGDAASNSSRLKKLSGAKLIGYRELEKLLEVGEEPPTAMQRELGGLCPKLAVQKRDWQRACMTAGISPKNKDAARKAFNRMYNELNAASAIKVWNDYVWLFNSEIRLNQNRRDKGTGQDK
jgi:hypothetical protein